MNDQSKPKDFLDLLVEAVAERVKEKMLLDISDAINEHVRLMVRQKGIHADDIEGLEGYFDHCMEDYQRNSNIKIDADDVEGLDSYIKETMKEATVNIDFV
jgi:hypothetical protein